MKLVHLERKRTAVEEAKKKYEALLADKPSLFVAVSRNIVNEPRKSAVEVRMSDILTEEEQLGVLKARQEKEKMTKRYMAEFGRQKTVCLPPDEQKIECGICYGEQGTVGFSPDCDHYYCKSCAGQCIDRILEIGDFPAVCPGCKASKSMSSDKNFSAGAVTTGVVAFLVDQKVLDRPTALRFKALQDRAVHADATQIVIESSSKPCPFCGIRVSHYQYHGCHHISPPKNGRGCTGCGKHFCYTCLAEWGDENCPNGCKLFCYAGCGCPVCPECRPGEPCDNCDVPCRACKLPGQRIEKYYSDEDTEDSKVATSV